MGAKLDVNWVKIRQEREMKGVDIGVLARKYDINPAAIYKRAEREGWSDQVKAMQQTAKSIVPTGDMLISAQQRVANKTADAMAEAMSEYLSKTLRQANGIMDDAFNHVQTADSAKTLVDAARAWEIGHNGARKALGLDRPDMGNSGQSWTMQPASVIEIEAEVDAIASDAPAIPPESLANPDTNT